MKMPHLGQATETTGVHGAKVTATHVRVNHSKGAPMRDNTLRSIDYALRRGGRTPETLADINVIAWHWFHDPWEERPDHPVWEMWDAQVGFTFLQTMGECRRIRLKNKLAPDILPTADLEAALERHRQRKKKDSE